MIARVDAHVHLWDPAVRHYPWLEGLDPIHRAFHAADLEAQLARAGVASAVLVQALSTDEETDGLLAIAAVSPAVAAVVGWADLTDPAVAERLAALTVDDSRVRAIRASAQDEPDPAWLLRDDVRRGIRAVAAADLTFELLVRRPQRPTALELARREPDVGFVLDHAGKPAIVDGEWESWLAELRGFAALDNVDVKLSGLVTEAGADPVTAVAPYAAAVLDAFGPDRVMFGSDWPVCLLAADYTAVDSVAGRALLGLSERERDAVLAGTARRVYRLPTFPSNRDGRLLPRA